MTKPGAQSGEGGGGGREREREREREKEKERERESLRSHYYNFILPLTFNGSEQRTS